VAGDVMVGVIVVLDGGAGVHGKKDEKFCSTLCFFKTILRDRPSEKATKKEVSRFR
jgi:hypothetical protein